MVAVCASLLTEISGLDSTTAPLDETTALWMSISLELSEMKSVSSFTWRLVNCQLPTPLKRDVYRLHTQWQPFHRM